MSASDRPTPGELATEIAYSDEPVRVRRMRLESLAEAHPLPEVTCYFEMLVMEGLACQDAIREKIVRAFGVLRDEYEESGGWRYIGPRDADEGWGWIGPYAWSEADIQHRFATLLEAEFPRFSVHLEMPINERMRSDLDPLAEGVKRRLPQYIDIVVADPTLLHDLEQTAQGAGATFRAREHEAFVEVKWFPSAAERFQGIDRRRFLQSIPADLERLHLHTVAGRCTVAAMLVVDDRGTFVPELEGRVPGDVMLLPLVPPMNQSRLGSP